MRNKVRVQLKKDGERIDVLPEEVQILREAGLLLEEETQDKPIKQNEPEQEDPPKEENWEPEQKGRSVYTLPVLTRKQRRQRIREARKLIKKGYSIRETARRLNVSHTSVLRWKRKGWNLVERSGTF